MSNTTSDNSCGGLKQSLYFTTILDKKFYRATKLHYTLVKTLLLYTHGEVVLVCIIDYLCMSASHCMSVCLSVVCLSSQERGYGQENASPIPFNFSEGGGEDRSRKSTNMPPPKTKKLLNPRARPSGLQRPLQRGGGTRVLGVRPNGCKRTEGPMKPRVR